MDIQKLLSALGPLAEPYQDETITEIMVDAPFSAAGCDKHTLPRNSTKANR